MNRRQLLRIGGATALTTLSAGCSFAGDGGPKRVSMTDSFEFDPKRLTVSPGTTVRWVNDSNVGHTVTAYEDEIPADAAYFASGGYDSERAARNDVTGGLVAPGETYEQTFDLPGTYDYYCIPHESSEMFGTVVVE